MNAKPQAFEVIDREAVIKALDEGWMPAQEVFLDYAGVVIGRGKIVVQDPDFMVRRINPQ